MSRLPLVPDHKLDDFFRDRVERDKAEGRDPALNAVMAHNPQLFERDFSFFYPAHEEGVQGGDKAGHWIAGVVLSGAA